MKKTLTIVLAFVLVIAMSVAGTFAYLTSQDSVTNTFTVGKVAITLDEAKTDAYGLVGATATARVKANEYKLIAGHEYVKDPIVHVDADSESCWLFIKVEDGIAALEADTTIAAQLAAAGWTPISKGWTGSASAWSGRATHSICGASASCGARNFCWTRPA